MSETRTEPPAVKRIWDGTHSLQAYREALGNLREEFPTNYVIAEIPQILSQIHRPKILIRHDVRSSLSRIWAMAQLEKELGFRTSYMIQRDSPHLDLARQEAVAHLRRLRELGHEVGLHLAGRVPAALPALERYVQDAGAALGRRLGFSILSVSFSSPPPHLPGDSQFVGSKVNAAAQVMTRWTLDDSQTAWEIDPPKAAGDDPDKALLQVIIRPELWD